MKETNVYGNLITRMTRAKGELDVSFFEKKQDINWELFLGMILFHRVNGVFYKKLPRGNEAPDIFMWYLSALFSVQKERLKLQNQYNQEIADIFESEKIEHAFLKGAILNNFYYDEGEKFSNDTDILVKAQDIGELISILNDMGYKQGNLKNGKFVEATQGEKLFARINTYETVPMIKEMNNELFPYHEIDINFRLSNDDPIETTDIMLKDTKIMSKKGFELRTLSPEKFLLYLCVHLYREAVMIFKIVRGGDLLLYKFMDIHHYIKKNESLLNWGYLRECCDELGREKEVYYSLYHTELLYPDTIQNDNLQLFKPRNIEYLEQYRGKDNSLEVYNWNMSFKERVFDYKRKFEALDNLKEEHERHTQMKNILKGN